ncbi:hypothetical protein [Tranquillimonas alkanivorans]|uniref:Uncharacterized protein n=1 Tax=Tranquillimonas alkanivorans TaxID=441119 RepID=A0A1I5UGH8_9RHOB|nr:hypothetical protein [Tranquillimonas alkanivorans]SFP94330.1 hypothetical protein SAMN04488047_12027 [Tranquillimonas alkanivorans]
MLHKHTAHHHARPSDFVTNVPHQHAFTLVGEKAVFAVHMTQYHHEEHKYQLVMKITLPSEAHSKLASARARFPADTFMLCNDDGDEDLFMIPDLPARRVRSFRGNVFQGLPPFTEADEAEPHFFPWDKKRTRPLIADIEVQVERIVTFRPFAHHLSQPDFATYLLWGEHGEAHMTSLQTARLSTGPFEAPMFGPDYDHVMSLREAPDWLDAPLLEAGIVVSVPALRLKDVETGAPTVPCGVPFADGQKLDLLYRGMGQTRAVTAGRTVLAATAVCNSEGMDVCPPETSLMMSATPRDLLR